MIEVGKKYRFVFGAYAIDEYYDERVVGTTHKEHELRGKVASKDGRIIRLEHGEHINFDRVLYFEEVTF